MYTSLVLYFSIFALSMERTRLSFHCWLYNLCIVVYVTNKTWNLKLETSSHLDFWETLPLWEALFIPNHVDNWPNKLQIGPPAVSYMYI